MQNKNRFLFFSLAGILMALMLLVPDASASAEGNLDSILYGSSHPLLDEDQPQKNGNGCLDILWETVNQSGNPAAQGEVVTATESSGFTCHLYVDLRDSTKVDQVVLTIQGWGSSFDPSRNNYASMGYSPIVFHGYPAMIDTSPDGGGLIWWVPDESGPFNLEFVVFVFQSKESVHTSPDPTPMAEILYSIVQKRRPELNMPSPEQPALPVEPGEVVPGQPELPTDQTVPTEIGGLFGIPLAVILASLGIPVLGALTGAVLSAIVSLSGLSSASASSAGVSSVPVSPTPVSSPEVNNAQANLPPAEIANPQFGDENAQGLFYDKREWDKAAGPGWISEEQHKLAQSNRDQDREWTDHGGWQTKQEQEQSKQGDKNNRKATDQEDAEYRAKREAELKALEEKDAKLDEHRIIRDIGKFDI